MKHVLFATAALAAVLYAAAPSWAAEPTGHVGVSYAKTDIEDLEADTWAVDGAVAFDLSGAWGMQFDGSIGNTDYDGLGETETVSGTAHLFTRNESYAIGGFFGLSDVDDSTVWNVGVEGQTYMANTTLAGSFSYGQFDDADLDSWSLNGEARYFVSDNFRLDAGLGWTRLTDGDDNVDGWNFGIGGEYQFASAPISLTAGYTHSTLDDVDVSADTFRVGLRYNFGAGTLKERDRSGASFNGGTNLNGVIGAIL